MTINTGEPTIPPVPQPRNTQKTLLTQSRVEEGQMARQFLYNRGTRERNKATEEEEEKKNLLQLILNYVPHLKMINWKKCHKAH